VLKTAASSRRSRSRVSVEQRRVEILEATRAVVLEKGFGGTRIKDVADALGVSTGLVHYHFESKDELLAETMRYAADADIRRLEKTVAAGSDPVAWIRANPGRIHSIHCKDWSPEPGKGYTVLFGEGAADWKGIFAAAESVGGVEYYLVEQEGSRFPELETAQRCLKTFRSLHS